MSEKKKRTKFSREIRDNVVKLVIDGGQKCADVAAAQHIPLTSVYAWVRQARLNNEQETGTPANVADLQKDNVRLRRELKIAKDHALFLRKTAAFFASLKK